jgi:hypothetical protein
MAALRLIPVIREREPSEIVDGVVQSVGINMVYFNVNIGVGVVNVLAREHPMIWPCMSIYTHYQIIVICL